MWIKPEMKINKFDGEDIITESSITLEEAEETVTIKGAKESFKKSWSLTY